MHSNGFNFMQTIAAFSHLLNIKHIHSFHTVLVSIFYTAVLKKIYHGFIFVWHFDFLFHIAIQFTYINKFTSLRLSMYEATFSNKKKILQNKVMLNLVNEVTNQCCHFFTHVDFLISNISIKKINEIREQCRLHPTSFRS